MNAQHEIELLKSERAELKLQLARTTVKDERHDKKQRIIAIDNQVGHWVDKISGDDAAMHLNFFSQMSFRDRCAQELYDNPISNALGAIANAAATGYGSAWYYFRVRHDVRTRKFSSTTACSSWATTCIFVVPDRLVHLHYR